MILGQTFQVLLGYSGIIGTPAWEQGGGDAANYENTTILLCVSDAKLYQGNSAQHAHEQIK